MVWGYLFRKELFFGALGLTGMVRSTDVMKIQVQMGIFLICFMICDTHVSLKRLGKLSPSKMDEFSEKFQTSFDPPLIFGKLCCKFLKG